MSGLGFEKDRKLGGGDLEVTRNSNGHDTRLGSRGQRQHEQQYEGDSIVGHTRSSGTRRRPTLADRRRPRQIVQGLLTGPRFNGAYLSDFRSFRGSGILPRLFHPSRLEGAPTQRYALSQCHWP